MTHHLDATINTLIALSSEMSKARRWDDVKALQDAAQQLSALRDSERDHPIMGDDTEFDAESWSALVD